MIQAVLTIDDIASRNTPAIVDYLREKGIRAVMFAVGTHVEKYYSQALYAVQKGMIVGNHSDTHPAFSGLTLEKGIGEIERCEAVLDRLYRDAGVPRAVRPFRFPYGDKGGENRAALQRFLAEKGFHKLKDDRIPYPYWKERGLDRDIDTFWTFDFAEYQIRPGSGFTLDQVWDRIHGSNQGAPLLADGGRHILLLHAHDETEEMVPGYYRLLIDHLLDQGVVFMEPEFSM